MPTDNGAYVALVEKLRRTYSPLGYCKVGAEDRAWIVRWDGERIGGFADVGKAHAMAAGADEVLGRIAHSLGVFDAADNQYAATEQGAQNAD